MIDFLTTILLVFGVLQIILFFKMWGMTNDVAKIKELLESKLSNMQIAKEQTIISRTENKVPATKEPQNIELPNDIDAGDSVIRLSDGEKMVVDSVDDGQYFCKGSFMEGYSYYKRDEIKKIDSTRPKTIM